MAQMTPATILVALEARGRAAYLAGERPRPPLQAARCAAWWRGWDAAKAAAGKRGAERRTR